ncbi:AraC family transcriptional regulator [Mangrovimonas sp. AS39]|uniref:AraC family transcriptional regulator n=1 Tax=Mangrovimonas TaxID=1211036 RepID=UPI0014247D66|nr:MULTISPECIES: AraC family transcriptional regulator [Mangrovimonas]MCF1192895.1 AraC family transcriptional regulator [Mangrovimonas futianensis]MCF1196503.1 AraC family transcriptional regulator [Mangrovimonas futianensis]MCF1423209.1 AraC family transcriptional regulator [Mangrovimonas futianensis]NIK93455.1 AraC family transcriptional regulator [Mangrovimonas sp. CR14]
MNQLLKHHNTHRKITTLVENRTTYNSNYAELNIYETHAYAEKVSLKFDFPIIASMLTGKKVMHIDGLPSFDFFPGESVVMPTNKEMVIDFPLAKADDPTQCLALGIDTDKIEEVVEKFNNHVSIEEENNQWKLDNNASHLINNIDVNHLIERLVLTFTNSNKSKDVLLDLMIQELIVRLLQTKAKAFLLNDTEGIFNDTRIGMVIKYIKKNLTNKDITVDLLAEKACMSTSHFHKKFKNTLGISPIDYINSEKIKFSKKLIKESADLRISEIAFKSGFNNTSYFNRQFKKLELMTPQQFKNSFEK